MNQDKELRRQFAKVYESAIAPVYTGGKNAAERAKDSLAELASTEHSRSANCAIK